LGPQLRKTLLTPYKGEFREVLLKRNPSDERDCSRISELGSSQSPNQVIDFTVNLNRGTHCPSDFLAEKSLIIGSQAVDGNSDGSLAHLKR
jgi:hypothetical protein